jgi:hypothetical protein
MSEPKCGAHPGDPQTWCPSCRAHPVPDWERDDTTCWQCDQATTIASLSGDGLCPDCDDARNREGLPEFNGAFG